MRLPSKWNFSALQNEQVRLWTARTRVTSVSLTEDSHPENRETQLKLRWRGTNGKEMSTSSPRSYTSDQWEYERLCQVTRERKLKSQVVTLPHLVEGLKLRPALPNSNENVKPVDSMFTKDIQGCLLSMLMLVHNNKIENMSQQWENR